MRMYRYGDPHYVAPKKHIDVNGQVFGTLTVESRVDSTWWSCRCECGEVVQRTYNSLVTTSRPTCGKVGRHLRSDVGYYTAHNRVKKDRGLASEYACSCGADAQQWAYNHEDPDEMTEKIDGYVCAYSSNSDFYTPMCAPCHKKFDLDRKRGVTNEAQR